LLLLFKERAATHLSTTTGIREPSAKEVADANRVISGNDWKNPNNIPSTIVKLDPQEVIAAKQTLYKDKLYRDIRLRAEVPAILMGLGGLVGCTVGTTVWLRKGVSNENRNEAYTRENQLRR